MKRRKNKYIPPKTASSEKNDQFSFKKLIAILLVVNLLTTGVSFSKYVTSSGPASDFARVAKFAVQVTPPADTELAILKPVAANHSTPYEFKVTNNSDVMVGCSVVITVGKYDSVSQSKFKVSCQLGDNNAQTANQLPSTTSSLKFDNLGTIPPRGESTVTLTLTTASLSAEDYKNDYIQDIKLSMTFDQID